MDNEIDIILSRYFSGEMTEKESRTLEDWLSMSDENEKKFLQMSLLYQYVGNVETHCHTSLPPIDTEKALEKFKKHIHGEIGGLRVMPTMTSKRLRTRFSNFTWNATTLRKYAAVIALLIICGFTIHYFFFQNSKITHYMAVETHKECQIFDNANVTLFPGAEIIYDEKGNNEVQLKGKATFNISSPDNMPVKDSKGIVVLAGETYIKDIGTIFTVDATNPDECITVEVEEGEVWFYTNSNSGVHIKANESTTSFVSILNCFIWAL
jgi:ferric-dicitrate binding protein FerR (iron transport regulator)